MSQKHRVVITHPMFFVFLSTWETPLVFSKVGGLPPPPPPTHTPQFNSRMWKSGTIEYLTTTWLRKWWQNMCLTTYWAPVSRKNLLFTTFWILGGVLPPPPPPPPPPTLWEGGECNFSSLHLPPEVSEKLDSWTVQETSISVFQYAFWFGIYQIRPKT